MKLRSIAVVLTVVLASAAANAQSGIYVTMDAQQFNQMGVNANPLPGSANTDRPWLYGPTFGVYYTVTHLPRLGEIHTGPVAIGIDARGDVFRRSYYGSQFDRADAIFSLRFSPKKTFLGSTPYLQGGFGLGHTRNPFRTYYNNDFVYQFGLGVDRKLSHHFDWRVIEATTGFLAQYPTGYYASGNGANQSNYLVTLGTGLVYRIR